VLQTKLIFLTTVYFVRVENILFTCIHLTYYLMLSTRTDLQNLNAVTLGFLYRSFRVQQDHDGAFYLAIMFFPEDHTASLVPTY